MRIMVIFFLKIMKIKRDNMVMFFKQNMISYLFRFLGRNI